MLQNAYVHMSVESARIVLYALALFFLLSFPLFSSRTKKGSTGEANHWLVVAARFILCPWWLLYVLTVCNGFRSGAQLTTVSLCSIRFVLNACTRVILARCTSMYLLVVFALQYVNSNRPNNVYYVGTVRVTFVNK